MRRFLGLTFCAISFAAMAVGPARAAEGETFKIGALLGMTGASSYYGTVMSRGAQIAIDEINADGGIDGTKLELLIEDHKGGNAQAGVAGMNRLINIHDIKAVLTSFSPPTLAVAPIATEKKIFMINGGGFSAKMIGASPYLFHNRSLATDFTRGILLRAKEHGFEKMAMISVKTDAGENVREIAHQFWPELGGEIVSDESVAYGAANMDTQIAKLRTSGADFIFAAIFRPDAGTFLKRSKEFGITVPRLGIEYTPDDQKLAGEAAAGFEFTTDYFHPTDDNPWAQAFYGKYKELFNEEPDYYAANYYEGVYVIAELVRRAFEAGIDNPDGAQLTELLWKEPTFKSVYGGDMVFQENGVAQKRVGLFEVQADSEKKFLKFIETTVPGK